RTGAWAGQGILGKLKEDKGNAKVKYRSIKEGAWNTGMVIEPAGPPGAYGPAKAVFPLGALTAANNGADYATVAGQYAYTQGTGWADPGRISGVQGCSADGKKRAGTPLKPINGCNDSEGYSFHAGGMNAVFADGSVHFISENIDAKMWAAMVTRQGGEIIGDF